MTNGFSCKHDIQTVTRLFNVFKEQFNLFFCEKNGRVDGRKTVKTPTLSLSFP